MQAYMLRTVFIRRVISTVNLGEERMNNSRYFPNPFVDYRPTTGHPEIELDAIKQYLLKDVVGNIETNFQPIEKNGGDGVYLGTTGISYMFYHLSKIPTLHEHKNVFLKKAMDYIIPAINVARKEIGSDTTAFILGNCGVYAVAAALFHSVGDQVQSSRFRTQFYKAANVCKTQNFLKCGSDELFVGRAGYIMGALWLAKETNTPLQTNDIYEICKTIVKSGQDYKAQNNSACPLMYAYYETEYFGAAHGLCSILQCLLSVPGYLDANPEDKACVWSCVDFLLNLQTPDGNFPAAPDEIGNQSELLVQWCHGAAGMFYLMAKAFLLTKNQKYLDSCRSMSDLIWKKGLLKKGPGICHGVAGNAYVFLLLYRITNEDQYLHRAKCFYEFLRADQFKKYARTPDSPYSLYEGLAGTACYIADLTCPEQACFPFSDIF